MSSAFMSTRTYELIRQGIEQKKQMSIQYKGYTRNICPYVLGKNKYAKERAIVLLIRNTPSGPLAAGWECLDLEHVWNAKFEGGDWVAAPATPKPETDIVTVELDAEASAAA
jgi:hypothetical protein